MSQKIVLFAALVAIAWTVIPQDADAGFHRRNRCGSHGQCCYSAPTCCASPPACSVSYSSCYSQPMQSSCCGGQYHGGQSMSVQYVGDQWSGGYYSSTQSGCSSCVGSSVMYNGGSHHSGASQGYPQGSNQGWSNQNQGWSNQNQMSPTPSPNMGGNTNASGNANNSEANVDATVGGNASTGNNIGDNTNAAAEAGVGGQQLTN